VKELPRFSLWECEDTDHFQSTKFNCELIFSVHVNARDGIGCNWLQQGLSRQLKSFQKFLCRMIRDIVITKKRLQFHCLKKFKHSVFKYKFFLSFCGLCSLLFSM